jgi:hypothetical protein
MSIHLLCPEGFLVSHWLTVSHIWIHAQQLFPTRLLTSEDEYKWYWHQMIYFPETINTISMYNNYTFTDTFTCFFLSYARQHTLCMLASRSHAGVVILGLLSSSHVFSLPLSGLN